MERKSLGTTDVDEAHDKEDSIACPLSSATNIFQILYDTRHCYVEYEYKYELAEIC